MAKLKVKKGLEANLPAVEDGSLLITTDSKKLYLDNGEERIQVGGDSGSAGTYLFHLKFTDATETVVTNIDGDSDKLYNAVQNGLCVIARVHDYEDMIYFNDYYISSGTGSSTAPASPYEFNYYDGLKLHCITINDFTDTGLSYSVSSTGVRTILFTKTSSTEYTCGTDVALIVEENAVVGKVPNEGNNGYTFFYKVRDSIDNTSATPSDTVATTFISCDGNTIKKLTTQYSDYGVWHYSEQSLSGGGADSSIYTSTGIKTPSALTDGFPIMSSDGSTNYVKVSEGTVAVKGKSNGIVNELTSELIATPDIASPTGDDYAVSSIKLTSRLCGGPAGTGYDDTSLVFLRGGAALGNSTLLATSTSRSTYFKLGDSAHIWDEGHIKSVYSDTVSAATSVTSPSLLNLSSVKTSSSGSLSIRSASDTSHVPMYLLSSGSLSVRTEGVVNSLRTFEIFADPDISSPTASNYAFTSFKFTTQCAGGPQGTGTWDSSLVYGFDSAVTTALYSTASPSLGTTSYPWGNTYVTTLYIGSNKVDDYIIASYHSGNTHYVKWASGVMEQWMSISKGTVNSSDWATWGSSGLYYYDITNTSWPEAFSATHNGTAVVPVTTITAFASDAILWVKATNPTATALPKISLVGPANMTRYSVRVDVHAVGYWK